MKFEIIPEYRFKSYFKYFIFSIGVILSLIPLIISDYEVLSFFGLIIIIIGLFYILFMSKQYLRINNDLITFESKRIVKEFSQLISIDINTIKDVYFLKRQFLIFGGRSPIADADAQRLYNENRIVFVLKDKKSETIMQTGKLEDFKKAYTMIKLRVDNIKGSSKV